VCIEMNKQKRQLENQRIRPALLRWSVNDTNGDLKALLDEQENRRYFDIVFACDCLFFEDFHDALIDVLLLALGRRSSGSSGESVLSHITEAVQKKKVLLFQPSRGGSMERLLATLTLQWKKIMTVRYSSERFGFGAYYSYVFGR
jgi:hypothetical protein